MKPNYQRVFTILLFVLVTSINTNAQWQPCLGLEGGQSGNIIRADSFLLTSCIYSTYRTDINFSNEWEACPETNGGVLFQLDSCIISYKFNRSMKRSFDNGNTWEGISGYHSTNSMCSVGSTIFFDYGGLLLKSEDYMNSVETATHFPDIDIMKLFSKDSLLIAFDFFGVDLFHKSLDTAQSWDTITTQGFPTNQERIFGLEYFDGTIWTYGKSGIFYLNPEETYWYKANSGLQEEYILENLCVHNSELYCSTQYNGIFKLNISDTTWNYIEDSPNCGIMTEIDNQLYCGTNYGPTKMDSVGNWHTNFQGLFHRDISSLYNLTDAIYVYADNELFKSFDNGLNFEIIEGIVGNQIIATDSLLYSLSYSDILISKDNGISWDTITYGLQSSLYHLSITDNYYYISSSHGLFRSNPDSINWIVLDNGLSKSIISHFEVIDSVAIVDDSYYSDLVCISKDYGNSFDTLFVTNGKNIPIKKKGNRFYILFNEYILYSDDLGTTWGEIQLENALCLDQNELYLVVSTNDPGPPSSLLISCDSGQTWTDIDDNIPQSGYWNYFNILFYDFRLFTSSTNNSLWFRDDILTSIPNPEIIIKDKALIYPNPANDIITLRLDSQIKEGTFVIFDINGRKLINGRVNGNQKDIDLSILNSGVYIIVLKYDSEIASQKFIKY